MNDSLVGITVFAEDHDPSDEVTYSLADGANDFWQIDSMTGVVTVKSAPDHFEEHQQTIEIKADSSDGSTSTASFEIVILENIG